MPARRDRGALAPGSSSGGAAHANNELKPLGLRLRKGSPFISYILVKQQTVGVSEEQADRAIFVAGLPLGVEPDVLREIFTCFGDVDQVALHPSKVGGLVRRAVRAMAAAARARPLLPPARRSLALPRAAAGVARACAPRVRPCLLQTSGVAVFEGASGASALLKNAGRGQIVEYHLPEPEGSMGLKGGQASRHGWLRQQLGEAAGMPPRPARQLALTRRRPHPPGCACPAPPPAAWVQEHKKQRPGNKVLQQQVRRGSPPAPGPPATLHRWPLEPGASPPPHTHTHTFAPCGGPCERSLPLPLPPCARPEHIPCCLPPPPPLLLQLDAWVEQHDQQEEARRRQREAAMSEDGWTVVVRGKVSARLGGRRLGHVRC
jgi:hypothetical protein